MLRDLVALACKAIPAPVVHIFGQAMPDKACRDQAVGSPYPWMGYAVDCLKTACQ
jgi:hypothetical protein